MLILGDSNGNGTVAGPAAGQAIPVGWTIVDQGVTLTQYPAVATGPLPHLVQALGATGVIVREAENGRAAWEVTGMEGMLRDARLAWDALGVEPDLIWWVLGANDSQGTEPDVFPENMRRWAAVAHHLFPTAAVVFHGERTTDTGQYPGLAANRAALAALADDPFLGGEFIDWDDLGVGMADEIHASDAGHAQVVAELSTRWSG